MRRFPILLLSILLSLASLSLLEYERALTLRVEGMMKQSPTTKSYNYLGDGWFEFADMNGMTWQRNFGDTRTTGGLKPKKIISIDLRLADTTVFSSMFTELSIVPIGIASFPPIGSYVGKDSLCELSGQFFENGQGDYNWLYKKNSTGYMFNPYSRYDVHFIVNGCDDLDHNGIKEIVGDSLGSILSFEGSTVGSLDLKLKHFWYGKTGSAQVPRIADMDNDGHPEVIISQFGDGFDGTRIVKYSSQSQKLERVYQIRYPNNPGHRGYYAVGDFDQDGRMEFANANYAGQVFFIEHVSNDTSYAISFSDTTRYINAFFHTEGNDLDSDGRPECFIGSDNTGGCNNIAVYETTGNNRFEVSLWIEIYPLGSFIWPWIWAGDVTGDGKQELVLSSGNAVVILKAFGDDDYRVIWFKRYNSELSHRLFDVDRDGKMEILVSMYDGSGGFDDKRYTRILSYNGVTAVEALQRSSPNISIHTYPNPMNGDGYILLSSEHPQNVTIRIFDSVGRIVEEYPQRHLTGFLSLPMRKYLLPQGIYFIQVTSALQTITNKMIVL